MHGPESHESEDDLVPQFRSGVHFLQIPGPTNVPDRVLRAIDRPTIDHRGPDFAALALEVQELIRPVFGTTQPVVVYPASGTGAWEAALVNTLSPGDRVLMAETGQFAVLWSKLAARLGLHVEIIPGDWRHGVDPAAVAERLTADSAHAIKAVAMVHNETSTGVTSRVADVRAAIDGTRHPALFLVDTISSLASIDYRHDEWGVDVTVGGSQKGLMLPPGLAFNAISEKALAASRAAKLPRSYWAWDEMLPPNREGFFPYTPATNLLYGLREALHMLHEETLSAVFARHARHGEATRRAVRGWGLEILALDPREYSNTLTAIVLPDGVDADALRATILERFDMSLGTGLGKLKNRVFRIGHLGSFNDLMLAGTLCGVQMGLDAQGIAHGDGVSPALAYLANPAAAARSLAAV
ncbi:MAG: alanine-glyoxylate transaminase / serine-glyoxylate transaminase / serine-pyruvate transaminase [Candidatus Eremiobacteraeota bacterium]|nr:alanine-glyoxylate transaminase / serine-glyoxylate transaminase / serine-pyruvate transaminase [Candidatus Eremiobacteraeota bacterium]